MRVILRSIGVTEYVEYLTPRLPDAEWSGSKELRRTGMGNFFHALRLAGGDAALHMEDDIILTRNFMEKVNAVIDSVGSDKVIQFFSLKKTESGWDTGFSMNQCFYLPAGNMGQELLQFAPGWLTANPKDQNGGYDLLMGAYFKANKIRHWVSCPSLVQHRSDPSNLSPRSRFRQSASFVDPWD